MVNRAHSVSGIYSKEIMGALMGGSLIITIFLLVMAIAWIVLPIALIGTKPLLRELIKESKETNRLLKQNSQTTEIAP